MADTSLAQLGRKLVGLPASLVRFQTRVLFSFITAQPAKSRKPSRALVVGESLENGVTLTQTHSLAPPTLIRLIVA